MTKKKLLYLAVGLVVLALIVTPAPPLAAASPEVKEFKLGMLNSMTGAFVPESLNGYRGSKIAVDMINARGGIAGKVKVIPEVADAQSNPDIGLRETERLISMRGISMIIGVYSSAIARPVAVLCEKNKVIFSPTIAISDSVVKDRHLHYTFRIEPMGSQWAYGNANYIKDYHKKLGFNSPSDIKCAVINEDGPYGCSVGDAYPPLFKEYGMQLVLKEAYSHEIKDMTPLILKLKASKQDVIFHTGYAPDVTLLLRQGPGMGLKTRAILGAAYAVLPEIAETVGEKRVNYHHNIDPPLLHLVDRAKIPPDQSPVIDEFLKRVNAEYGARAHTALHYSTGFAHTWIFLDEILPRALKKYGDLSADSIKKAARETDIPDKGTVIGYGVKFAPTDHVLSGQNLRSSPCVMQYVHPKWNIVWPEALKTAEPVIPIPQDSPFRILK
jgi:branched-chain amino acid transport system substrate-binding protein